MIDPCMHKDMVFTPNWIAQGEYVTKKVRCRRCHRIVEYSGDRDDKTIPNTLEGYRKDIDLKGVISD